MESSSPTQEEILAALGVRLAELRGQHGLTQEQAAELASLDVQAVQRAETGRTALSLERLAKLGGVYGAGLAELFEGTTLAEVDVPWSPEEARIVATVRSMAPDRRGLVEPLLKVLSRSTG